MMRKGCLLLMLALSGPGCLSSAKRADDPSRRPPPVQIVQPPPSPAPAAVTADQVNESNAPEIAQALAREMDYDAKAPPAPPLMTNAAPTEAGEMVDLTPAGQTNAKKSKP